MATAKVILTEENKREVELKQEHIKSYIDLRNVVMKSAILRRTEQERKNGRAPMDVGAVTG